MLRSFEKNARTLRSFEKNACPTLHNICVCLELAWDRTVTLFARNSIIFCLPRVVKGLGQ